MTITRRAATAMAATAAWVGRAGAQEAKNAPGVTATEIKIGQTMPYFLLTSTAASLATGIRPAGVEKAQGIMSMQYLKDPTDPAFAKDQGMLDYFAWMKKAYPEGNPIDPSNVYGYSAAQTLVQVLKQCGNDLSRENIMRQAENLSFDLPPLLPGGRIETTPTDHYPIKTVRMARFEGDRWVVMPPQ